MSAYGITWEERLLLYWDRGRPAWRYLAEYCVFLAFPHHLHITLCLPYHCLTLLPFIVLVENITVFTHFISPYSQKIVEEAYRTGVSCMLLIFG